MASSASLEYLVTGDELANRENQSVQNGFYENNDNVTKNGSIIGKDNDYDGIQVVTGQGNEDQTGQLRSYQINRPLYSEQIFHSEYKANEFEYVPYGQRIKKKVQKCNCGPKCCRGCVVATIPIAGWLPHYVVRNQLLSDVISGLTVCVMNIPQGMAYAMLASVPPVYGLYLGFFAPIVYAVTGTCRELAVGTYSVISIMVSAAIESVVPLYPVDQPPPTGFFNNTNTTATSMPEWDREQELVDAAIILALLVGIIQLILGILRLGWVTIYLSDPFIRGYTTGSGFHVFTSQVDDLLGVSVGSYSGTFGLFYIYRDVFQNIDEWNYVTILLSLSTILTLILIKELEIKFKKQLHGVPLAPELVVVILGTLFSWLLDLEGNYDVDIVGEIPAGIPAPKLPDTTYLTDLIGAAVPIAIVAYAIGIALASLFSQKNSYKIDANQELIAFGSTNFICCFFSCYPASASVARSMVQEGSGATSQIAGLVNSALMLVVLLWIGPLFETLPEHVWWVTCVCVIVFDVDVGLLMGVGYAIFMHVWRTQEPYCTLLGNIPNTDIYKDIMWYEDANEIPGIKIFCMQSSLYFANTAHFKARVFKLTKINPRKILQARARQQAIEEAEERKRRKQMKKNGDLENIGEELGDTSTQNNNLRHRRGNSKSSSISAGSVKSDKWESGKEIDKEPGAYIPEYENSDDDSDNGGVEILPENQIHTIVFDFAPLNFIDSTGLSGLQQLYRQYHKVGVKLCFAHCKKRVRDFLSRCDFYESAGCEEHDTLFVTVHDAVVSVTRRKELENRISPRNDGMPPEETIITEDGIQITRL
ncbi:prestin-like [Saccoglossus kowalevskii]|uniref:Prestin-like n=1 Tax=Saccoglossus kowalevskii TaxID=10224 RepID=A0ABM0MLV5_SACKO|nr:PREDICTED: prestin-like [Saccoglossus kowalevskii]